MPQWLIWAILGGTFVIFLVIQIATGTKKPIRKAVGNMALGVVSLLAVNLAGFFTGVTLPVSTLSLSVAATCFSDYFFALSISSSAVFARSRFRVRAAIITL